MKRNAAHSLLRGEESAVEKLEPEFFLKKLRRSFGFKADEIWMV